jgi:Fur family peroxide stress response transcriptional regulator
MSFATVYNTLAALSAARLCAALSLAPGSARFDPNMQRHDHVVCDACGSVRDVPPARRDATAPSAVSRAAPGFKVRSVEQIFRGLCATCARRRSPES